MSSNELRTETLNLQRLAAEAEGLQKRYTAYLGLYDAACMSANAKEMEQRREECHTLLDSLLDNARDIYLASARVRELMNLN